MLMYVSNLVRSRIHMKRQESHISDNIQPIKHNSWLLQYLWIVVITLALVYVKYIRPQNHSPHYYIDCLTRSETLSSSWFSWEKSAWEKARKEEKRVRGRRRKGCEVGRLPSSHVFILTRTLCQGLIPILWPFINVWNMRCPTLHFPPFCFLVHTMRRIFQACTLSAQWKCC